jgi:hypothetical protein
MKFLTSILFILFTLGIKAQKNEVLLGVNGFYSRAIKHLPAFPGGSINTINRYKIKENDYNESFFIDVGLGFSYSKGYPVIVRTNPGSKYEILSFDNNYTIDLLLRSGTSFNVRNYTYLFVLGIEQHYHPTLLNKNNYRHTRNYNFSSYIEAGILLPKIKIVHSIGIMYKKNLLSFSKAGGAHYKQFIGLNLNFKLL